MEYITISLPEETVEKVRAAAEKDQRSVSNFIAFVLTQFFAKKS